MSINTIPNITMSDSVARERTSIIIKQKGILPAMLHATHWNAFERRQFEQGFELGRNCVDAVRWPNMASPWLSGYVSGLQNALAGALPGQVPPRTNGQPADPNANVVVIDGKSLAVEWIDPTPQAMRSSTESYVAFYVRSNRPKATTFSGAVGMTGDIFEHLGKRPWYRAGRTEDGSHLIIEGLLEQAPRAVRMPPTEMRPSRQPGSVRSFTATGLVPYVERGRYRRFTLLPNHTVAVDLSVREDMPLLPREHKPRRKQA